MNSMNRTGHVTIKAGTTLEEVSTGKLFFFRYDTDAKFGVHPISHETVYNIRNKHIFFSREIKSTGSCEIEY